MGNYFDFHYHPMFKKYLSNYEKSYPTGITDVETLMTNVILQNPILRRVDTDALHFLGSQCSFDQLQAANEILGVANIVSLEYAIASASNLVGDILRSRISAPLDQTYFQMVSDGEISYFHLFIKELNLYSKLANIGKWKDNTVTGKINLLARSKNATAFESYTGTTLALAMEGGHNLNRNIIADHPANVETIADPGDTDNIYADFYSNCNTILSPAQSLTYLFNAMWKEEMDLLYITLTHLTYISELPLANHAYGMKLLNHNYFYPAISGLTDPGKSVISAAYGMSVQGRKTPILIDIKHMSVKSRLDFYDYRKQMGYTLPILATHMGVTGLSIGQWLNAEQATRNGRLTVISQLPIAGMDKSNTIDATKYHFNPWSINLMNEDIIEILNSDGLIGVSLDRRILGIIATDKNIEYDATEYVSPDEISFLKSSFQLADIDDVDIDPATDVQIEITNPQDSSAREDVREIACLGFNILHIVAIALNQTTVDPWSHIVIGSDFDGLIEPLSSALDCTGLNANDVESVLGALLPSLESSYLHFHPHTGVSSLLPRTTTGTIDSIAMQQKIRAIMYDNGAAFLKKWYNDQL